MTFLDFLLRNGSATVSWFQKTEDEGEGGNTEVPAGSNQGERSGRRSDDGDDADAATANALTSPFYSQVRSLNGSQCSSK